MYCQNRWWLLTNAEFCYRSVRLEWLQERPFKEQDLGRNTAEVESPTRDIVPSEWKLMKFSRESSDDLHAAELRSQLSGVKSSFCCLRLLDARVLDVDRAQWDVVMSAPH